MFDLGVKPSLSELEKFEESPEVVDIDVSSGKDDGPGHNFSAGDNVEVCNGELVNLHGKIISIDGNTIMVMPKHDSLNVSIYEKSVTI